MKKTKLLPRAVAKYPDLPTKKEMKNEPETYGDLEVKALEDAYRLGRESMRFEIQDLIPEEKPYKEFTGEKNAGKFLDMVREADRSDGYNEALLEVWDKIKELK